MLDVKNIDVYYGQFHVLKDVSMYIAPGEIVAIMGPNSAGKTTLARAISGIVKPRAGSITFDGNEITKLKPHEICNLGIVHVAEGKQIFPDLTVIENLLAASSNASAREKRKEQMKFVFDLFPVLKDRVKQKAGTLSGGERQMLAIALGLMVNPKILVLDEPSQGLAPKLVVELFGNIKKLCTECKIGILIIEQQVKLALHIASRGYLLINGKITLEGTKSQLIDNPMVQQMYLGG